MPSILVEKHFALKMFADCNEYCTIGRPKGQINSGDPDFRSPCLSKIGGVAHYQDAFSVPSTSDIECKVCHSSDKIVLVAQIYAPLDFHRSLYVYGCNNGKCSYSSSSWTVVRNQSDALISSNGAGNSVSSLADVAPIVTDFKTKDVSWDQTSFSENVAVKKPTVENDSDSEDDLVDLMAMLTQRDNGLKKAEKVAAEVVEVCAPAVVTSAASLETVNVLPCWRIAEVDEDWTLYDETNDDDDNDHDESEEVQQYYNSKGAKSAGDAHIDHLLQSYLQTEDDAEVLSVFKVGGGGAGGTKAPGVKGKAKTKTATTDVVSKNAGPVDRGETEKQEEQEEEGEGEASELKLSRSSERSKVEEYFLRRVGRHPSQVLRYAYGGQPLWVTAPAPFCGGGGGGGVGTTAAVTAGTSASNKKGDKKTGNASCGRGNSFGLVQVPCCELCGAERVFECQLMPALLSYISTDKETKTVGQASTSAGGSNGSGNVATLKDFKSSELFGTGLDFGVVAIYSCPNSCVVGHSGARRFATEVAVVQLPPDMIDLY